MPVLFDFEPEATTRESTVPFDVISSAAFTCDLAARRALESADSLRVAARNSTDEGLRKRLRQLAIYEISQARSARLAARNLRNTFSQ